MSANDDFNGAAQPGRGSGSFIQNLAEKMGASARAATVFGQPVERDGVTVVPVAKARWGFGGGGGRGKEGEGSGMGGGGGLSISPVGYIEVRNGQSRFRPIYEPMSIVLVVIAALSLLLALRILRGRRR